ncbi:hypothetical protein BdWA1_003481 [Babesia duncani]|uniref:Uncharacterized protein n=1 Tax=Babesia duncani TaxID=323732 RepID=A0AAD9PHX3_9APIC|nr:hypothetical protein BdWA1_003481 [Babesia duncani]
MPITQHFMVGSEDFNVPYFIESITFDDKEQKFKDGWCIEKSFKPYNLIFYYCKNTKDIDPLLFFCVAANPPESDPRYQLNTELNPPSSRFYVFRKGSDELWGKSELHNPPTGFLMLKGTEKNYSTTYYSSSSNRDGVDIQEIKADLDEIHGARNCTSHSDYLKTSTKENKSLQITFKSILNGKTFTFYSTEPEHSKLTLKALDGKSSSGEENSKADDEMMWKKRFIAFGSLIFYTGLVLGVAKPKGQGDYWGYLRMQSCLVKITLTNTLESQGCGISARINQQSEWHDIKDETQLTNYKP